MNQSLFIEYISKFFRLVVGAITEKINGKKQEEQLLHKTMLTEEYSPDMTWGSTELNTSIVAADVVSLDSSLPLKRRDKVSNASGKIPKLGMKYRKGETDITQINLMKNRGTDEATIASKIFDDVSKAIKGIDVRNEIMFQQALSTGVTVIEDPDNVGTGIRVDFGYLDENTFHAKTAKWGETTATPQDDVQQMFDKAQADGAAISVVMISKKYFDLFRKSEQGKMLAANYLNQVITDKSLLTVPSRQTFREALRDEYGAEFRVVDSTFRIERTDGSRTSVKPWKEANVVGLPDTIVGRLVYGTLAEETNPVKNVDYEKSGSYILVSKYSKTDPLEEFTASQALCLPVIDGADSIYVLHADTTTALTADPATLNFAKEAGSQTFRVHSDSKASVKSSQTWATAKIKGDVVTVAVTANSSAERSAEITVSDEDGGSVKVSVTQAAGE